MADEAKAEPAATTAEAEAAPAPKKVGQWIQKSTFDPEKHFYQRALNAQIHPLVSYFLELSQSSIVKRYTHLHPKVEYTRRSPLRYDAQAGCLSQVDEETLTALLRYKPQCFNWAGADLFNVTTAAGVRQMVVIETNSCPSGQKSMPILQERGMAGVNRGPG